MKHRVIFVSDDYWTDPPKKNTTMSDTDNFDADPADDARIYRGQLAAAELCRAVAANADDAADALYAAEDEQGALKYLVAGLCHVAISLARTVAEQHPSATEERVWAALTERSTTGLTATHEIIQMIEAGEQ